MNNERTRSSQPIFASFYSKKKKTRKRMQSIGILLSHLMAGFIRTDHGWLKRCSTDVFVCVCGLWKVKDSHKLHEWINYEIHLFMHKIYHTFHSNCQSVFSGGWADWEHLHRLRHHCHCQKNIKFISLKCWNHNEQQQQPTESQATTTTPMTMSK